MNEGITIVLIIVKKEVDQTFQKLFTPDNLGKYNKK